MASSVGEDFAGARRVFIITLYIYFFVFASMIRDRERERAAETRYFLVPGVQSFFYIYK